LPRYQKIILIIYGALFLVYVAGSTFGIFLGYDIWFHLKNGEFIVKNHAIPHRDPFLFSTELLPPSHYTNYEWLFGVITYSLFSLGHYPALNILRTGLIILILTVLFATSLRRSEYRGGLSVAIAVIIPALTLAFLAMFQRYEPRPQLISGLMLSLYFLLLLNRSLTIAHYGVFFVITLIWANTHIEIFFGIAALIIVTARQLLDKERRSAIIKSRIILILLILGIIIFSPVSKGLLSQGIDYNTRSSTLQNVVEMIPADLTIWAKPYGILLIFGGLSFFALFFIDRKKLADLLIFLPFAILPFKSTRHMMPATVAIAPIVASGVAAVLAYLMEKKEKWGNAVKIAVFSLFPIILVAGGSYFLQARIRPPATATLDESIAYEYESPYPDGAIRFLNRRGIEGRLFCPYHWGNFIIFYENPFLPKEDIPMGGRSEENQMSAERVILRKPFIDGMVQTYPRILLDDYMAILSKPAERPALLDKYKIDLFILPYPESLQDSFYSLITYLLSGKDYRLLYFDDTSMIIGKDRRFSHEPCYRALNPAELHLRSAAPGDRPVEAIIKELRESRMTEPGRQVVKSYIWEGMLLFRKGKFDESIAVLVQGERFAPKNALLLYNLAVAYARKGDARSGIDYLQRSLRADPSFKPALQLRDALLKSSGR
jgi:hypothetical protein